MSGTPHPLVLVGVAALGTALVVGGAVVPAHLAGAHRTTALGCSGTAADDVAPAVHCLAVALQRRDPDALCAAFTERVRAAEARTAPSVPRTCAAAARRDLAVFDRDPELRDRVAHAALDLRVTGVRVHGATAFASTHTTYAGRTTTSVVVLHAEGGRWRIDADPGTLTDS